MRLLIPKLSIAASLSDMLQRNAQSISLTQHHRASAMLHGIGQVLPAEYLAPSQQSQYTGKKIQKKYDEILPQECAGSP